MNTTKTHKFSWYKTHIKGLKQHTAYLTAISKTQRGKQSFPSLLISAETARRLHNNSLINAVLN